MSQGPGLLSIAKLSLDGQISMSFDLKKYLPDFLPSQITQDVEEFGVDHERWRDCPSMNIVIMIVGSRGEQFSLLFVIYYLLLGQRFNNKFIFGKLGDVQPYVALGQRLVKDGHRIRIATHEIFKEFITGAGLEFYNIGGDPQDLMNYMVKSELSS